MKAEMMLFRIRYETDDTKEREQFLESKAFGWTVVDRQEKLALKNDLELASPYSINVETDSFHKVRFVNSSGRLSITLTDQTRFIGREFPILWKKEKSFLKAAGRTSTRRSSQV